MNFFTRITSKLLRGPEMANFSEADGGGKKPEQDDKVLVTAAQAGDYSAFDKLVTEHRGKIYAMIYNMVKNDADAWDLTQDSFIKAWKALPKFENRSKFSTWLYRISHNVVYDWKRKKKIQSEGELDDSIFSADRIDPSAHTAPSQPKAPDKQMEHGELRQRIKLALEKLSDVHRSVIIYREVQGMDYKEIAEIMECSTGTVMSRLFNARKKLQQLLS